MSLAAHRDSIRTELIEQLEYCDEKDKEETAILAQLRTANKEIVDTHQLSEETKQQIFAMDPKIKRFWSEMGKHIQERMEQPEAAEGAPKLSPEQRSLISDRYALKHTIDLIEHARERRAKNVMETAIGQHALPNSEALDKVLRYETTIERLLSRAVERLDRLQRRRKGELVPPTLRVDLT